jgi:Ni,Fe-hydrogenase maturation factor
MAKEKEKTVLCFGSYVEGDNLAFEIYDSLKGKVQGKNLVKCKSPFELTEYLEKEDVIILDVVKGIKRVRVFNNVEEFKKTQTVTIHDMDLGFFIKILETVKKAKYRIIGVPFGKKISEVLEDVINVISSI